MLETIPMPSAKDENAPIEIEANPGRYFGRNGGQHEIDAPDREDQTKSRSRRAPMTTLSARSCRTIWRRVAPSASANPDFPRAGRAAREEQIRDVARRR